MSTTSSPRRTQAERSQAMRTRLIEATLDCLEHEGYAGTTVAKIVERAGVSHGAPLHHFASKAALIDAAADHVLRRIYIKLGHIMSELRPGQSQLENFILEAWHSLFGKRDGTILLELMVASRREDEIASLLLKLWTAAYDTLVVASNHYLEPITDGMPVHQLMVLTQWLFRGMAQDSHMVRDPSVMDHYLRLWSRLLAQHMQARPGVTTLPPRPPRWD